MNKKKKNLKKIFIVFVLIVTCLFSSLLNFTTSLYASAVTVTGYTSVLGDLQIDDNFKKEDYPRNDEDYSLKVIQIAESTGGELFIYTYQPSVYVKQFELTTITLSQSIENNANWKLYDLKLLDSDGVFAKYKVKGIDLKSDVLRYYDITEIHRKFDTTFGDKQPSNGNTITEISINISQQWTACTLEEKVYYNFVETETIEITDKYVGFVRLRNSTAPTDKRSTDYHYVAFNTDRRIDKLLEADLYYDKQNVSVTDPGMVYEKTTYSSVLKDNYVSLTYEDKVEASFDHSGFWKGNIYKWNKIQTVSDFISSNDINNVYEMGIFNSTYTSKLSDVGLQKINNMTWVLRFAETAYNHQKVGSGDDWFEYCDYTIVGNVTILRLKFETDGVVYNLGVIDNKTNGSGIPDNVENFVLGFAEWFEILLKVLGILFVIIIVGIILQALGWLLPILKFFIFILKKVGKGILWFITAPFYAIKSWIKKE